MVQDTYKTLRYEWLSGYSRRGIFISTISEA